MTYDSNREEIRATYTRNRNMAKNWHSKEKGTDLNRRNSLIFKKIQDLHTVREPALITLLEKGIPLQMVPKPEKYSYNQARADSPISAQRWLQLLI
jgi:hypothetical protein